MNPIYSNYQICQNLYTNYQVCQNLNKIGGHTSSSDNTSDFLMGCLCFTLFVFFALILFIIGVVIYNSI